MTNLAQVAAVLIAAALSAACFSVDTAVAGTSPAPISAAASSAPAFPPSTELRGRAYVFRGVLGHVFSTGMDRLTERIKGAGIPAQVYSFTVCQIIARDAIREYRRDPAPIILVGHSAGAFCTLRFAETLRKENISVSLIVDFDPPRVCPPVPMNVERYINVFISNAPLGGGEVFPIQGYEGHFASFDMKYLDLSHVTIDKSETIHEQVVAKIRQVAMPFARVERDAPPLRFVLPANAAIELWDSGTHVFARPGDTLESLAEFHRVPLWSIAQINRMSPDGAPLVPGQLIIVPRYLVPVSTTASPLKPRP